MRPSFPRLVRIIPRSQLVTQEARPLPEPERSDIKRTPLIELLQQRQASAGSHYPSNIRIEPVLTKATFKDVPKDIREELKTHLKER
ncbi:hypothetical protein BKA93DRAFT_760729 [Sparassis latifolia]|uniref:Uncharacterized protein n=1 Tax=Sparassis crispa TaxID=139825 RepID=A0A401GJP6_9APHY|nr:hypothetical protein SCP_0407680 [Sparassis crispa]GBE82384.1 hypothetical protein SCP_0407680 [Sparassis crispa]